MPALRVVSLLPSATEVVQLVADSCDGSVELVGRSHECDFPPEVEAAGVRRRCRYHTPLLVLVHSAGATASAEASVAHRAAMITGISPPQRSVLPQVLTASKIKWTDSSDVDRQVCDLS